MTIGSVSNLNSWLAQLASSSIASASTQADVTDSSTVSSAALSTPPPPPPRGGLMDSILQALSQIGVTSDSASGTSATSDSSSANASSTSAKSTDSNPAQALRAFIQTLMAAMHAQSATATSAASTSEQDSSSATGPVAGSCGTSRPNPASDLQSLIQKLAASSSSDSSSANSAAATSDPTLSNLETSFSNLVSAMGGTDSSQQTMSNFLATLASDMQGASPVGNLLSTQA